MRPCSLIFLMFILFPSCKKDSQAIFQNVKGNLAPAVGCQEWLIRTDSTQFQPLNLDSFQITLKAGQPVIFSYYFKDVGTTCQDGRTIQLSAIKDQ